MRSNILLLVTILTISTFFIGCAGTETPTNSSNAQSTNSNSNRTTANSNNPLGTNKTPEAATSNNAPTLSPVVQGYYAALQKKDEAGVKKFLSPAALKYWEAEMKSEQKNSLLAILEDSESPVEEKREVRNEKIEGATAVAELKGGSLGVWTKVKFIKENEQWKFASPEDSPEFEGISKSASNSNTGK